MFGLENMLITIERQKRWNNFNAILRQDVYGIPLLILSLFQNFDLYMNEQMPFDCTKDLQLRLAHNDT